jgi:Flp pilus assembly protein TadD
MSLFLLAVLSLPTHAAECVNPDGSAPDDVRAAGELRARSGDFAGALPCFEAAVVSDPEPWDWSNLGSVHHDLAVAAMQSSDDTARKTHATKSVEAFDQVLAGKTPPLQAYLLQASNHALLDDADRGEALLMKLLPEIGAPNAREKVMGMLGNLTQLPMPSEPDMKAYQEAFTIGSTAVGPSMQTAGGAREVDSEQTARGILSLERALRHHPNGWPAWWVKGKGHEALGDEAEARACFEKAYALHPAHPDVARELVLAALREGDVAAARPVSAAIVALHPMDGTLVANDALVQLMAGDVKGAQEQVAVALRLLPDDPVSTRLEGLIQGVAAGTAEIPKTLPANP